MIYREFARTGFKTSVVGMGTYYDPFWIATAMVFRFQQHRSRLLDALRAGVENGINFIDTAEIYRSETIVSDAIRGRKRDELFIASKVWSNHLKPEGVVKACKRSLEKLETSYLDLYQIHFPSSRIPIKDTMGAMEKLVDDGLIRAIGISNFSYARMLEAEEVLKRHQLSSTQMNYNILNREVEKEILPHCEKEKIAMIPYFPLAHGKLAMEGGKSAIEEVASKRGVSTSQVALGWLVKRSEMNFPIPRASRPNHVRDNASAGEFDLTDDEFRRLDTAYPLRA